MAFTTDDLDAIDRAIATGTREVSFEDGRRVQYNSLDELLRARDYISNKLGISAGRQRIYMKHDRDIR